MVDSDALGQGNEEAGRLISLLIVEASRMPLNFSKRAGLRQYVRTIGVAHERP